jgi:hypothetical protein
MVAHSPPPAGFNGYSSPPLAKACTRCRSSSTSWHKSPQVVIRLCTARLLCRGTTLPLQVHSVNVPHRDSCTSLSLPTVHAHASITAAAHPRVAPGDPHHTVTSAEEVSRQGALTKKSHYQTLLERQPRRHGSESCASVITHDITVRGKSQGGVAARDGRTCQFPGCVCGPPSPSFRHRRWHFIPCSPILNQPRLDPP